MLSKLSELRLGRFGPWFRRHVFWFAVGVVALVLWANRYQYAHITFTTGVTFPVRIHRLTGTTEILGPFGSGELAFNWETIESKQDEPPER